MSLNSNTWYAIQSFGTDYSLGAGNITDSSATVFTQSDRQASNALWQITPATDGAPSYIRSQSAGSQYCLAGTNGQASLIECSSQYVWTVTLFNGQDTSDGYYLAPGSSSSSPRLRTADQGNTVSIEDYSGSSNDDAYFQWGLSSVSAINDAAFSTVPGGSSATSSSSETSETSTSAETPTTTTTMTTTTTPTTAITTESNTTTSPVTTTTSAISTTTTPPPVETFTTTLFVTRSSTPSNNQPTTSRTSSTSATSSPTSVPGAAPTIKSPTFGWKSIIAGTLSILISSHHLLF